MDHEGTDGKLVVVNQGCVVSEHISLKNSVQKQVHVVVKNLAFQIELASAFDLTKVNLTSKLLYDFDRDDDPKLEVSYVKNEPMEYKVNIVDGGSRALVECKIKVLTSQHEDMLFRIQFVATDGNGQSVETYSKPIKVISKLTQLKKKDTSTPTTVTTPSSSSKKRNSSASSATTTINLSSSSNSISNSNSPDTIMQILARIEETQQQQQIMLQSIVRRLFGVADDDQTHTIAIAHAIPIMDLNQNSPQVQQQQQQENQEDVDGAFRKFISAVGNVPVEERNNKINSLLSVLPPNEAEKFADVIQSLSDPSSRKKPKTEN